jgi:4-hydroxyproline epimerase
MTNPSHLRVIDSHTGGEPTRLVISGGPDLGDGPLSERVARFRETHDHFRSAIVGEPRTSDVFVGALLCSPHDATCDFGVIFFNNVDYLGMCGHGIIGLVVSLAHLERIEVGVVRIETPVGAVEAELHTDGSVSVRNVASYRQSADIEIEVPDFGLVRGDVAWGGNWFFLTENHGQSLELENVETLLDFCAKLRRAINAKGHPEVDHIELCAPSPNVGVNSRNFVLCPGGAYDRSPCGTGTSAKLACLAASGQLRAGEAWRQESIIGSVFSARYQQDGEKIIPTITGTAHVMAEATLILDPKDLFVWGIR